MAGIRRELVVGNKEFVMVRLDLIKDLDGDAVAAIVAARIHYLSEDPEVVPDEEGTRWVDTPARVIAEGIGLSQKQVTRALGELERKGYITRKNRSKDSWDRTLSVALNYADPLDVPSREHA